MEIERNFDCVAKQLQTAKTPIKTAQHEKMTQLGRTCQNYLNREIEILN